MGSEKIKYSLTLTPEQAKYLDAACEFYTRINLGQWGELIHTCVDLRREDFCEVRDQLKPLLMDARRLVWPELQGAGHSWGIGKFENADIVWEIHEVLRNRIAWTEHPQGGQGVSFSAPMSLAGRPLAKCEVIRAQDTNE